MTTQTEALKLALEALELCNGAETVDGVVIYTNIEITAIKEVLAQPEQEPVATKMTAHRAVYFMERFKHEEKLLGPNEQAALDFVIALLEAQPEQEPEFASPGGGYVPAIPRPMPLDWKLVPRKATPEMLKAMDECAQEGYDERLYAGIASSVYMAAWDASPMLGTLPPSEKERSMMDMIVGNLVREGINKHRARELAEHFIKHITPPQRTWVRLTDEEMFKTWLTVPAETEDRLAFGRAVEAKLKEKNT